MIKCKDCKHWAPDENSLSGTCGQAIIIAKLYREKVFNTTSDNYSYVVIETGKNAECIYGEKKE